MPYTPPSQQSPHVSKTQSPILTRSHSFAHNPFQHGSSSDVVAPRPELPRSSSYLSRHRRSPSVLKNVIDLAAIEQPSPESVSAPDSRSHEAARTSTTESLRQSPPPVSDSIIPIGAVVSPPDSPHNSSDDDERPPKARGRQLENLAELQAAIRIIEQHRRGGSPTRALEEMRKAKLALEVNLPPQPAGSAAPVTLSPEVATELTTLARPLTKEARKISHSRSSTETALVSELASGKDNESLEESESSDGSPNRPLMLRKKSGELVKPAIRPTAMRRRPSSMPGTPTFNKAVHFDAHLEHVRHFLQVDRPVAVSAGSSPVEQFETEGEFPFGGEDASRSRGPPFEWEIVLSNPPADTPERRACPIQVERVFLSADNANLVGTVAVANLSFHKLVVARFTLDYWKTTSEVVAEYNHDVRRRQVNDGRDRFNFSIKLADQTNLEEKTMFFCVRFNVNGQEYWDNNGSMNYQVDFKKRPKLQHGKQGVSGAGSRPLQALPRCRPSPPISSGRPRSMPGSFDDFAEGIDSKYDFGPFRQTGRSRLQGSNKTRIDSLPDTPAPRTKPAAQAFGNRYDFGASLSAAISAANANPGDREAVKVKDYGNSNPKYFSSASSGSTRDATTGQNTAGMAGTGSGPEVFGSEKAPLESSSYHELLNKYCFFGSAKSTPPTTEAPEPKKAETSAVPEATASASEYNVGKEAGSPPVQEQSPPVDGRNSVSREESPRRSQSGSPAPMAGHGAASDVGSPVSFGYPYHHAATAGFPFNGTHTTAIQG
ncbi:MAG: hypothetical protein M1837_004012 [Sclerophora amabilis]|nr:MAG: hypothetical protein M1837_004012 [Sclerophora amabilis]